MVATSVLGAGIGATQGEASDGVLRIVANQEARQLAVQGEHLWSGGGVLRPRDVRSGRAQGQAVVSRSSGIRSDGRRAFLTVRNRRVLAPLDVRGERFRGEPEIVVGSVIYGLAATGGGLWVLTDCGGSEENCGPELRKLDPSTGQEITRASIEETVRSLPLAASSRRLWTAKDGSSGARNAEALAVEERNPETGRVLRTTAMVGAIQGAPRVGGVRLVATVRAGWLLDPDGRLYRLPEGGEPRLVGLGYQSIATNGRSLWGLSTDGRVLRRIDPDNGRALCEIAGVRASTPPAVVAPLVVGPTRVWTSNTAEAGHQILIGARIASCVTPMVRLSAAQLRINQRISQAAVLRVNALAARLDGRAAPAPDPDQGTGRIVLSATQLRINQRISQAAVLRVNALEARFREEEARDPTGSRGDGAVTLSATQLRINQRISQAAVLRVSALQARAAARDLE